MDQSIILDNEATIRLSVFLGMLVFMGIIESIMPRRAWVTSRVRHWLNNLGIVVFNSLLLKLLLPLSAIGMATFVQEKNWGLLNMLDLPVVAEIVLGFVILDCVIYWQHVMFHKFPILWRLHRVHHADQDFDVTTGTRFHPVEILASMLVKFVAILVLGPPLLAVLMFETVLNGAAMFNHSNVKFNKTLDRFLRLVIVTPDMHRVHHSVLPREYNSNFGFNLPWWDRLFGSYTAQPEAGHENMTIGLKQYKDIKMTNRIDGMLIMPFRN